MTRLVATLAFALLFLGMQHRLLVHEIGHIGARLDRGPDVTLHVADGVPCIECSLLAGGSNAVPPDAVGHGALLQPAAPPADRPAFATPLTWRAHYRSRAPPRSQV